MKTVEQVVDKIFKAQGRVLDIQNDGQDKFDKQTMMAILSKWKDDITSDALASRPIILDEGDEFVIHSHYKIVECDNDLPGKSFIPMC